MSAVRLGPVTRVRFVGGAPATAAKRSSSVSKIRSRRTIATWCAGSSPAWTARPPALAHTIVPVSAIAPNTSSTVTAAAA